MIPCRVFVFLACLSVALACTPCTPVVDHNSVIEAFGNLQVNVAFIPDYGNCPVTNIGYAWSVNWGDGTVTTGSYQYFLQFQAVHGYDAPGNYTVVAEYCSVCGCANCSTTCGSCAVMTQVVSVESTPPPTACVPCLPLIDNRTVIQSVPGYRASAAILPDYGSCSVLGTGYSWLVNWGDNTETAGDLIHLNPYHALHQFDGPGTYNITGYYCSSCGCVCDGTTGVTSCPSCASTWEIVKIVN